jgi:hypothetical protein
MSHAALLCAIEGQREDIPRLVAHEMAPFDENNECFRKASRWDWWIIGGRWDGYLLGHNVIRRDEIDLQAMRERIVQDLQASYVAAEAEEKLGVTGRLLVYGIEAGESEAAYVRRRTPTCSFPRFWAFLRNRRWNEKKRMGWFGCETATECEIAGKDVKRCLVRNTATEAAIVSWGDDDTTWQDKFFDRFVRDLEPETLLVVVDYHV